LVVAGGEVAGTVTFLLTDIVGSTQLWERDTAAMAAAMVVHDRVIDDVVVRSGGTLVRPRGEGDSRFAVFGRASDAAAAAVRIVAGLRDVAWPTPEPVRVRVGLRTGEAETRDGDYYGTAVNLCARLRGLAHSGQVLMSETTARLVRATPPAGVSVRDVGVHRLKGLSTPERVFQLCHADLEDDFRRWWTRVTISCGRPARGDEARATRLTDLARGLRDGSRPVESVADAVS